MTESAPGAPSHATEERVRLLLTASAELAAMTTVGALAACLAEVALVAFSAATTAVLMLDEAGRLVLVGGTHPLDSAPPDTEPTPEMDAARRGETVVVSGLDDTDSPYSSLTASLRAAKLAALSATPILDGGRVLGVLLCSFRTDRDFAESLRELQQPLTAQAAQAMLRLRLVEERHEEDEKNERLWRMIQGVSVGLRSTSSPPQMMRLVARELGEGLDVDVVRICVLADNDIATVDVLWPHETEECGPRDSDSRVRGLATALWSQQAAFAMPEPPEDEASAISEARWFVEAGEGAPEHPILLVPLGERDAVLGLIAIVGNSPARSWAPIERAFVQSIAADLAHNLLQASFLMAQAEGVQRLVQLDQERTDLIATVSHELRTPLASVIGYVDLIAERLEGEGFFKVEAMLGVVQRSAARLRVLIEQMMTAARPDGADEAPVLGPVDVSDVLRSVARALGTPAASKGVSIDLDVTDHLVVHGHHAGLDQAFANIVGNAVKFSDHGGAVTVRASHEGLGNVARVVVTVTDTGIGIPAADLSRIGTKLFRASNAMAAAISGTGLGLFIAQKILNAAGGGMTLTSSVGTGTTVVATVPDLDIRSVG